MRSKIKNEKLSIAELIQLLQTNPESAYQEIVKSRLFLDRKFWGQYIHLDIASIANQFPNNLEEFIRLNQLNHLYVIHEFFIKKKREFIEKVIALNPNKITLIKSFYRCVELSENAIFLPKHLNATEEILKAIKTLFTDISVNLKRTNFSPHSIELLNLTGQLLLIQKDIELINEFIDVFLWADFILIKNENTPGSILSIPEGQDKKSNLFILNQLKLNIKRDFLRKESNTKISEENHFKLIDPTLKTNEGRAVWFHSDGFTVENTDPGVTSLQIDGQILEDMNSEDSVKKKEATLKFNIIVQEQNFHYQVRRAMSSIYQPNDIIDIHALQLEIKTGIYFSIYELICSMSCVIAIANVFKEVFNKGSIPHKLAFSTMLYEDITKENPLISKEDLLVSFKENYIRNFNWLEDQMKIDELRILEKDSLLNYFRKVKELSHKSDKEIMAIIELFSSDIGNLPFNPFYQIDGAYFFPFKICTKFDFNRILYDYYITGKLFSPLRLETREDQAKASARGKKREECFGNSLSVIFKTITPYSISNLEYGGSINNYEFGELEGDIDTLAYFEKENILIAIQNKLNNVSTKNEKRKNEWIEERIKSSALKQVNKDSKLLKTAKGLKFVAKSLGLKGENLLKNPIVYHLIVTDNFFVDHVSFPFNCNGDHVLCISYFELKQLILNQSVHDKQTLWPKIENKNGAKNLIKVIEDNVFWSFLDEFSAQFSYSKKLSYVNDEYMIEMMV